MFKRNQVVMLLAVASLGMPLSAVAEVSADPAAADPALATVHDHEADRLPTRQRDGSFGGTLNGWAASGQEKAGKVWDTVTGESLKDAVAPGTHTGAWLTLQSSGSAASANPQAASSVQREKAADRFLKTYDFPIKQSFYGEDFKTGK